MCDQDHFEEDLKKYSRRDLGIIAAAGLGVAMLPKSADAAEVSEQEVMIKTPDGECDAYFVTPSAGKHAAVLVWPDIFGLRPAFRQMGKRLAESGYAVLVVNPFYRKAKGSDTVNASKNSISEFSPLARMLSPQTHVSDAQAFVTWLVDYFYSSFGAGSEGLVGWATNLDWTSRPPSYFHSSLLPFWRLP